MTSSPAGVPTSWWFFSATGVERLPLAAEDKAFLVQAGLPADAAPFLTFDAPKSADLPTVAEQWGVADELRRYRVIGSDGSGNPIVLDEKSEGEVVWLDHENRFSRALMNKSIRQMAESLLAYRKLVKTRRQNLVRMRFSTERLLLLLA